MDREYVAHPENIVKLGILDHGGSGDSYAEPRIGE
jgi:hypothetical protein